MASDEATSTEQQSQTQRQWTAIDISVPEGRVASAEFRQVYANSFRFRLTELDFAITFGCQSAGATEKASLRDEVSVLMALPALKILAQHLAAAVAAAERTGATIPIPGNQTDSNAIIQAFSQGLPHGMRPRT